MGRMWDITLRGFFDDNPGGAGDDDVVGMYKWLSIPRFAATIVSVSAIALFWAFGTVRFDPKPVLFMVVPAFLAASITVDRLIRRKVAPMLLLDLQLFIDLCGVTAGVLLTGGVRSPFVLLYILVIISASLVSVRTLIGIGVATAVLYEMMAVAEHARVGRLAEMTRLAYQQQDAVTIVIFGLIIGLIAFQSSYYVSRIREKDDEVLRLKDEFLFRTIHDLRSPSTVIRFTVEKYKGGEAAKNDPAFRKDLDLMSAALGRMSRLIEDLLQISRGAAPEFIVRADRLDLASIVSAAAAELAPVMDRTNVSFAYDLPAKPPMIIGDSDKLKEVFSNFLDNAVKYNRDGGSISIVHRHAGKYLVTDIADTGKGISRESLEKLFTPYFRGDADKDVPGTGLGLYITKKLLEKMGGKVEVSSTAGKGSTFSVLLPAAKDEVL